MGLFHPPAQRTNRSMNIIPFLFALLIAFQLLFFALQREIKHVSEEFIYSRSSHFLERTLRSKEAHRELPKKRIRTKKNSDISKNTFVYKPVRNQNKNEIHSRLNLVQLFQNNKSKEQETLRWIFSKVLIRLYGDPLFAAYGKKSDICEKLIKEFKNKHLTNEANFTALFPEDEKLSELFYTMLKGTSVYKLPDKGIAPFHDFFHLSDDPKAKAICFPKASKELLEELFGEKNAFIIMEQEKKKSIEAQRNISLNLSELEALLNQEHFPSEKAQAIFALMDFTIPTSNPVPEESFDKLVGLRKKGNFANNPKRQS